MVASMGVFRILIFLTLLLIYVSGSKFVQKRIDNSRVCLSDLTSFRKPEFEGDFVIYANGTGGSEKECRRKCIERLEYCTATMFVAEKRLCLFSHKPLLCENGNQRQQTPISQHHVIHCISCSGIPRMKNGQSERIKLNSESLPVHNDYPEPELLESWPERVVNKLSDSPLMMNRFDFDSGPPLPEPDPPTPTLHFSFLSRNALTNRPPPPPRPVPPPPETLPAPIPRPLPPPPVPGPAKRPGRGHPYPFEQDVFPSKAPPIKLTKNQKLSVSRPIQYQNFQLPPHWSLPLPKKEYVEPPNPTASPPTYNNAPMTTTRVPTPDIVGYLDLQKHRRPTTPYPTRKLPIPTPPPNIYTTVPRSQLIYSNLPKSYGSSLNYARSLLSKKRPFTNRLKLELSQPIRFRNRFTPVGPPPIFTQGAPPGIRPPLQFQPPPAEALRHPTPKLIPAPWITHPTQTPEIRRPLTPPPVITVTLDTFDAKPPLSTTPPRPPTFNNNLAWPLQGIQRKTNVASPPKQKFQQLGEFHDVWGKTSLWNRNRNAPRGFRHQNLLAGKKQFPPLFPVPPFASSGPPFINVNKLPPNSQGFPRKQFPRPGTGPNFRGNSLNEININRNNAGLPLHPPWRKSPLFSPWTDPRMRFNKMTNLEQHQMQQRFKNRFRNGNFQPFSGSLRHPNPFLVNQNSNPNPGLGANFPSAAFPSNSRSFLRPSSMSLWPLLVPTAPPPLVQPSSKQPVTEILPKPNPTATPTNKNTVNRKPFGSQPKLYDRRFIQLKETTETATTASTADTTSAAVTTGVTDSYSRNNSQHKLSEVGGNPLEVTSDENHIVNIHLSKANIHINGLERYFFKEQENFRNRFLTFQETTKTTPDSEIIIDDRKFITKNPSEVLTTRKASNLRVVDPATLFRKPDNVTKQENVNAVDVKSPKATPKPKSHGSTETPSLNPLQVPFSIFSHPMLSANPFNNVFTNWSWESEAILFPEELKLRNNTRPLQRIYSLELRDENSDVGLQRDVPEVLQPVEILPELCPSIHQCMTSGDRGCKIETRKDGCQICTCVDKSYEKGCEGPQGLSKDLRKALLMKKKLCPDGRRAQSVYRYYRANFGGCRMITQPYCGFQTDLKWRMPRTRKECQRLCYPKRGTRRNRLADFRTKTKTRLLKN